MKFSRQQRLSPGTFGVGSARADAHDPRPVTIALGLLVCVAWNLALW